MGTWKWICTLLVVCSATLQAGLSEAEVDALGEALKDERLAQAFYAKAIESFGERRPFSRIIEAEKRHENALLALYETYGLTPPVHDLEGAVSEVPATFAEACALAAKAEEENVALYDNILAVVTHDDVRATMTALQAASQERHLVAFRRHANGTRGAGHGAGRGAGYGAGAGKAALGDTGQPARRRGCGGGCAALPKAGEAPATE